MCRAVVQSGGTATPVAVERFGLTKLLSEGTVAIVDGNRVVNVTMSAGRSAVADFHALADTYGATVRVKDGVSIFEIENVSVGLRNFSKTAADWTIQVQNSLKNSYIKIRYGTGGTP